MGYFKLLDHRLGPTCVNFHQYWEPCCKSDLSQSGQEGGVDRIGGEGANGSAEAGEGGWRVWEDWQVCSRSCLSRGMGDKNSLVRVGRVGRVQS